MRPVPPDPAWRLRVGPRVHDLAVRTLVVAALAPVPDAGPEARPGAGPDGEWWTRAGEAAGFGADVLAVPAAAAAVTGAVRALPTLRDRAGRPVAVATAATAVAAAATAAGAEMVLDLGSGGPDLAAAVAAAGATLVVGPGADPEVVLARIRAAGLPVDRLALDPGAHAMPAGVVRACVVRVDPDDDDPTVALAAVAEAVVAGARVVVTPDVVGTVKVVRMLEAIVARVRVRVPVPVPARSEAPTGVGGSR